MIKQGDILTVMFVTKGDMEIVDPPNGEYVWVPGRLTLKDENGKWHELDLTKEE